MRTVSSKTVVGLVLGVFFASADAQVLFTDTTLGAGIDYQQHTLPDPPDPASFRETHYMSGGAAAADFDGDGDIDLFVTRLGDQDILFSNNGDGTFSDVTAAAQIPLIAGSNGVAWGDVDADGDPDLYITSLDDTRFYLLINNNGVFSDQTLSRGAGIQGSDEHHGMSVAIADFDNDGFLDIHTNEWRPDALNAQSAAANSRLLRNRGIGAIGVFDDVTQTANVAMDSVPTTGMQGTFSFASRFHDMDNDGHLDLLITGDFGSSRLFWNNGDGTFSDGTVAAGVGSDENGMGSAIGDVNGDGLLDWFVTAIYDPADTCSTTPDCQWGTTGNRLYRNNGDRTFTDITDIAGVRDGSWGWGATFIDYDNDGDLDLAMATGQNFPDETSFTYEDAFEIDALRFWENDGNGVFTERAIAIGLVDTGPGKGMLKFDYDGDGDQDLFYVNNGGNPVLYRNDGGNSNDWLRIRCAGVRHCFGARIGIRLTSSSSPRIAEMQAGSNFLGQDEPVVHFGLGTGAILVHEVKIDWPAGVTQVMTDVPVNTTLTVYAPAIIDGTPGNDIIYGSNGNDVITGGDGMDQLVGGLGDDNLNGGNDNDVLLGGDGNDHLDGELGNDQISGGSGDDTVSGGDGIDSISGGTGNDTINGGAGNDVIFGDDDDDQLFGGGGSDSLWGGNGNDVINGESEDDILYGGAGDDTLDSGDGNDSLSGEDGDDILDSGPGGDDLYAGPGNDTVFFDADDVDGMTDFYDGGLGIDILDLRLSQAQLDDPAIQLEIAHFANFMFTHTKPASVDGLIFTFFTLDLQVRNFEVFRINGIDRVGDDPVVYVDPDAATSGSGSLLNPFSDWASVVFQPGTTYRQKSGSTYTGSLLVDVQGSADQPIVIESYETVGGNSSRPKIVGPVVIEFASYVTLRSFNISADLEVAVTIRGGDHISIIDCEVSHSDLGIWMIDGSGPGNVVRSNLIHNNDTHGVAATLANGAPGDETYIDHNSIYANGVHGIEIQANHIIIERNEVAFNGWREGGTSAIHIFSADPLEDAAHDNIVRLNVTSHTFENYGPDGNGIELDKWSSKNDVYSNIVYNNGGQGLNMFRADSFRVYNNVVFDNMKSPAHLNFARPTEVFIGSFSLNLDDQVFDYFVQDNIVVSNGNWSGSGNSNIISILIDAPTIFNSRVVQNNRYFNTAGGNFFLYGFDPGGAWGGGVGGNDIDYWNELKVNGAPDVYGGVSYQTGSGVLVGGPDIDIILGEGGNDTINGAEGDDVLLGGNGNDVLDGGPGSDRMVGGRGNDVYYLDDPMETVLEFPESGADTIYSSVTYNLVNHVENLVLTGDQSINGLGNNLRNFMVGNDRGNALDGRGASDVLLGNGGNDYLQGGPGVDYLDGGSGSDIMYGGPDADIMIGGPDQDVFIFVKGEGGGAILDFEGNQALGGDLLKMVGFGPGATISYTGADGIYRIDFLDNGVPSTENISLIGVVGLHPVDYVFE